MIWVQSIIISLSWSRLLCVLQSSSVYDRCNNMKKSLIQVRTDIHVVGCNWKSVFSAARDWNVLPLYSTCFDILSYDTCQPGGLGVGYSPPPPLPSIMTVTYNSQSSPVLFLYCYKNKYQHGKCKTLPSWSCWFWPQRKILRRKLIIFLILGLRMACTWMSIL